ncbi:hypothetical protein R3P38DRAFT_2554914 [Favolaschia claudopus]|uniref:CxC2-like cysteine cluster KDZ transposase-associated domain-containing protein n=1 Tax=Favolaschia claudopus TaxID=2862362 RepID=A0AAW0ADL8_9AGAR
MRARLFPATMKETKSAFTFTVLKECHLHNLESKKASYDYMGALRRLTDNSFTADVPDPYSNFLRSIRFWDYLTMLKRLGQMHGIDRLLPHRPEGNLVLYCPACPEPGFNSEPNASSIQRTLDGNFQCNQYKKNSNPDDVSLCKGKAHFPVDRDYRAYLKENPGSTEKSTCNYLKAVNKQDKKKFKNMAITGTANAQCSHVFILSSVDLHYGEKFSNGDYALVSSLRLYNGRGKMTFELRFEIDDVDEMATYDIACEYTIHLESRIAKSFPDVLDKVKKMRRGARIMRLRK